MSIILPKITNRSTLKTALRSTSNKTTNAQLEGSLDNFIQEAEDADLINLRLPFMKSDPVLVTLDSDGKYFDIPEDMLDPLAVFLVNGGVEIEYQKVDSSTGRRFIYGGYASRYYYQEGRRYYLSPAKPEGELYIVYYRDFDNLGEISSDSVNQENTFNFSGTATSDGTFTFASGDGADTVIEFTDEMTAAEVVTALVGLTGTDRIKFSAQDGNNFLYWIASVGANAQQLILSAPEAEAAARTLTPTTLTVDGLTIASSQTKAPLIVTVETNWFVQEAPVLYHRAAAVKMFTWLQNSEMASAQQILFDKAVRAIEKLDDQSEFADIGPWDGNYTVNW